MAKKSESLPKTLPRRPGTMPEWLKAIDGGEPAGCHFDWAGLTGEAVLLGNIAIRTGRRLAWDGENARFTNHEEANKMVKEEYRDARSSPGPCQPFLPPVTEVVQS